jgi:hypothetical protein
VTNAVGRRLAASSADLSSAPTKGGDAVITAVVFACPVPVVPPGGNVEHGPPGNAGVHEAVGLGEPLPLGFGDGFVLGFGDGLHWPAKG